MQTVTDHHHVWTSAPDEDDRTWAVIAHAGSFVAAWVALGVLAPLLVLALRGRESTYVRHHALESLQFQLNALLWIAVAAILVIVLVGFVLLPLVGVAYVALVARGAVMAHRGVWWRYPMIVRLT